MSPMPTIKTYPVSQGTIIEVPSNFIIMQLLHPPQVDAHYWPSCRVVIQGFNDQSIVKVEFIVIDEGEVPQGYGYAGTVVHTNPKYRAHFAFKVIYIND